MIITRQQAEEMQRQGTATIEPGYTVIDDGQRYQVVTDHKAETVHHYPIED